MKKLRIITVIGLCFISLVMIIATILQQSNLLSKKQTTITKADEDCGCPGSCCDDACSQPNPPPECDNFCASHPGDCPPPPTSPPISGGPSPTDVPVGNQNCTTCTGSCSEGCSNAGCVLSGKDCIRACNCRGTSLTSYACSPCGNNCPANPPQTGVASCSRKVCSPRGCAQYKCSTVNYVPGPGGCNLSNECSGDPECQSCGGPQPSPTPIPPPPTATPTPVPPTAIITPPPVSGLSNKAGTPSRPTQAWTCLDADFCYKSANCSTIAGVDYVHRVRLKNGTAQLQSNTRTYIFECLQVPTGYQCTSGSPSIDNEIIGANHLPSLSQTYGYQFIKLTAADGSTVINQPQNTRGTGGFGSFEWESTTTNNVGRTFFAVQNISYTDALDAPAGTLHQGTVTFEGKGGQKCLLIKYDPHGTVLDQITKQPINNATITLLQKNDQNKFIAVTAKDFIGGIVNPLFSDENGNFAFMVPDGTYQIKVEKIGYRSYLSPVITQKGKSEYVEVILQRLSLFEKISQFISNHRF